MSSINQVHIKQSNDLPAAPPDETEQGLWASYTHQLATIKLASHQDLTTRGSTKLQRYFNSGQKKYALGLAIILSQIDNQPVTVKQISEQILASRQATLLMLNDCVAEGWATLDTSDKSGANRYTATEEMVDAFKEYAVFHYHRICEGGMYEAHSALTHYRALRDKLLVKKRQAN